MHKRLEFVEGNSSKFWEVTVDGTSVQTRYGKIGSSGQQTVKEADSAAAATKLATKLVEEKTRKGYVEVGAAASSAPAASVKASKKAAKPATDAQSESATSFTPFAKTANATDSYPAFPTPMPLRGAARGVDLRFGVFAIAYDEPKVHVVDSSREFAKTTFELPAKKGAVEAVRCIKVVLYEDSPSLVIGYSLKSDDGTESAAIGLFRVDGTPIVVHAAVGKYGVDVLAVSPDGEFLVWRAGGVPFAASVADFVSKSKWPALEASPFPDLVFDENGALFEYGVGCSVHEPGSKPCELLSNGVINLYAVGDRLLGPSFELKDGKFRTVNSSAWAHAVKGEDGDDEFTDYQGVGEGGIACFGPGSTDAPHLVFVDINTHEVLLAKALPKRGYFYLFLQDGTLYIVDEVEMMSMPWPALQKLRASLGSTKDETLPPLVGVRKTIPMGDNKFPARLRLREEVLNPDINHGVIAYPYSADEFYVVEPGQEPRKVELAWQSEWYLGQAQSADVNGVKVVLHDGTPCLAISATNEGPPSSDGPSIGIYHLDGTCLAIRYHYPEKKRKAKKEDDRYAHMKLLAASLEGDRIAWAEGYTLCVQTVSDFISGSKPEVWDDEWASSVYSAAFSPEGELYVRNVHGVSVLDSATKTAKLRTKAGSLYAVDQGVFAETKLFAAGKTYRFDPLALLVAVGDPSGSLTVDSAVGADDILCVGPISRKNPHLCFVQASTGKVLSVQKRPNKQLFDLFLMNGLLFVVDARSIVSTPWPGSEPTKPSAPAPAPPKAKSTKAVDPALAEFQAFKAKLKKLKNPLVRGLEAIEAQFKQDKKLWKFEAAPPKSSAEREALLTALEARHQGVFLPTMRAGLLDLYGVCDGFSFVLAPKSMPDPSGTAEDREEWDEAIVGYEIFSIERFTSPDNAQLFRSEDPEEPIEELFASHFKEGAKADSAKFLFASYLSLDLSEEGVVFNGNSTYYHQSNVVHGLALKTASFLGGVLSPDGDDQWSLSVHEGQPADYSFSALVAAEIEEALEEFA